MMVITVIFSIVIHLINFFNKTKKYVCFGVPDPIVFFCSGCNAFIEGKNMPKNLQFPGLKSFPTL